MFTNLSILNDAQAMARHAAAKQSVTAQNIANADTPGYKARDIISFQEIMSGNASRLTMTASRHGHLRGATEPHPPESFIDHTAESSPDGNSVTLENEILKSIGAERQHSRAVTIYQTSMNILRTSLGRGH